MEQQINRIKYEPNFIKAFNGRTKIGEYNTESIDFDDYVALVEGLEDNLHSNNWVKEGHTWKSPVESPLTLLNGQTFESALMDFHSKIIQKENDEFDAELSIDEEQPKFIPDHYREKYGKKQHCGDIVAQVMDEKEVTIYENKGKRVLDMVKFEKIAEANNLPINGSNSGQKKMNLSNRIRTILRKGGQVDILGVIIQGVIDGEHYILNREEG